jgi:putative oxidoreductase
MTTYVNFASVENTVRDFNEWLARVALVVAPPVLRIALAVPFFKSGLTKWDGFLSLSPAATFLFEEEFKLHIFGQAYDFPLPPRPSWAAWPSPRLRRPRCRCSMSSMRP